MDGTPSSVINLGRVKWFNNKSGFGFITVTDGQNINSDIFVHHSAIQVDSEQYKYLVQGEYVEFILSNVLNSNKHQVQATNVKGIKGGKLMCETRNDMKSSKLNYKDDFQQAILNKKNLNDNGSIPKIISKLNIPKISDHQFIPNFPKYPVKRQLTNDFEHSELEFYN